RGGCEADAESDRGGTKTRVLFLLAGLALLSGIGRMGAPQPAGGTYSVTPQSGNWVVLVASYTQGPPELAGTEAHAAAKAGTEPDAAAKAYDFVEEIRTKYKTPAYVFNRGAEERRKQQEEIRQLREKCPQGRFRTIRIQEQYAVLVGGYKDSETARKE